MTTSQHDSPANEPAAANRADTRPANAGPATPASRRRFPWRRSLMISVPLLMLLGGAVYWLSSGRFQSTDDAYLHQARITIASELTGRVVTSNVADNKVVHKGDLLFAIDATPYKVAVEQARAALDKARLDVGELKAAYKQAVDNQRLARSDAEYRASELKRQQDLASKGVSSRSSLDDARNEANKAAFLLAAATSAVSKNLAALGGNPDIAIADHPTVAAARAALDDAEYKLSLTRVTAPADGVIYQAASFKTGQMVTAALPMFTLVETADTWVEANFKETQIAGIAPGDKVDVEFDSFPGTTYRAQVTAVGAGTGAEFSLLPAQNATGNWVKVTQRLPVRIRLDDPADTARLRAGMSAYVTVDTGEPPHYQRYLDGMFGNALAAE